MGSVTIFVFLLFTVYHAASGSKATNQLQPFYTLSQNNNIKLASNSSDTCFVPEPSCDFTSRYRTFDGTCNNVDHPTWGRVNTAFVRFFDPRYTDGESTPPLATDGSELPLARSLSVNLFPDGDVEDEVTLNVMQFGQFVAHDIATSAVRSNTRECCNLDDPVLCYPIIISSDDPFYSDYQVDCLNFVRSLANLTGQCDAGPLQQINGVTHFIDGSQIYGSDAETAESIREYDGGRLLISQSSDGRHFLPQQDATNCVNSDVCYKAGDSRVNQNSQLTVLQTLFLREHNRIAAALASLHADWDDETLYQEARRILVAQLQHIIYDEYLPPLLGDTAHKLKRTLQNTEAFVYENTILPLIINEFTAGAFRILHSGIQGILNLYDYQLNPTKNINISDFMNSPSILEDDNNFDELLIGLITQRMQKIDEVYTIQMDGLMLHASNPYGLDLSALDIQRGRDHAIASYSTILNACTGLNIRDFDDLFPFISEENIEKLQQFYTSVYDIDYFVGGNLEVKRPGETFTTSFQCIILEQFYRLKYGDRFWFEVRDEPHSFTEVQLGEIRKSSLARVICDSSDAIVNVARNVFRPPSDTNPIVPCSDVVGSDLSVFP